MRKLFTHWMLVMLVMFATSLQAYSTTPYSSTQMSGYTQQTMTIGGSSLSLSADYQTAQTSYTSGTSSITINNFFTRVSASSLTFNVNWNNNTVSIQPTSLGIYQNSSTSGSYTYNYYLVIVPSSKVTSSTNAGTIINNSNGTYNVTGTINKQTIVIGEYSLLKVREQKNNRTGAVSYSNQGFYNSATNNMVNTFTNPNPEVDTPIISPADGTTFTGSTQQVTITAETGATIYYTTDGSTPSSSNGTLYSSPFNITESTTIKAIAYLFGSSSSIATSFISHSLPVPAKPVIAPADGSSFTSDSQEVSITCATSGASIYYTTDNTTPSASNGTLYTGPFNITTTTTVQAVAIANGVSSNVTTSNITHYVAIPAKHCYTDMYGGYIVAGSSISYDREEYNTPDVDGVTVYMGEVADQAHIPVIVYNMFGGGKEIDFTYDSTTHNLSAAGYGQQIVMTENDGYDTYDYGLYIYNGTYYNQQYYWPNLYNNDIPAIWSNDGKSITFTTDLNSYGDLLAYYTDNPNNSSIILWYHFRNNIIYFSLDAPTISPNGGAFDSSTSVTATCGANASYVGYLVVPGDNNPDYTWDEIVADANSVGGVNSSETFTITETSTIYAISTDDYGLKSPVTKVVITINTATEITLAGLAAGGSDVTVGEKYALSDDYLVGVYYDDVHKVLYAKDHGDLAVNANTCPSGATDYMNKVFPSLAYDQSNWVALKLASGTTTEQGEALQNKRLTGIVGTLTNATNLAMTLTTNPTAGATENYTPNTYITAAFAGETQTADDETVFFVQPKPNEYAIIKWAEWDGEKFVVPTSGNALGLAGSFYANSGLFGQTPSYTVGTNYEFQGVIRNEDPNKYCIYVHALDNNNELASPTVHLYAFDSNQSAINGAWPGTAMGTGKDIDGGTWYYAELSSKPAGIIFNTGNNTVQTVDITGMNIQPGDNFYNFWYQGTYGDKYARLYGYEGAGATGSSSAPRRVALKDGSTPNFVVYPTSAASQIPTDVKSLNANRIVKEVKYVNVMGIESDRPHDGINIVVTRYTDGTTSTAKMIK